MTELLEILADLFGIFRLSVLGVSVEGVGFVHEIGLELDAFVRGGFAHDCKRVRKRETFELSNQVRFASVPKDVINIGVGDLFVPPSGDDLVGVEVACSGLIAEAGDEGVASAFLGGVGADAPLARG